MRDYGGGKDWKWGPTCRWSKKEMMVARSGGASCEKREVFGFWVHFVDRNRIEVGL